MSEGRLRKASGDAAHPFDGVRRLVASLESVTTAAGMVLSCGALAASALIGLFQIVTRFILDRPAPWSEPTVRTLLIWMVYLGLCGAIRNGAMVAVDVVYNTVGPRLQRVMRAFILIASVGLFALLFYFGLEMAEFVRHQNLAGVGISIAWAYAAIPVGSLLATISLLAHAVRPQSDDEVEKLKEQAL